MSISTRMRKVATKMGNKFGELATFTRTLDGAFNPSDGSLSEGTTATWKLLVIPMSIETKIIDGESIKKDDRMILLPANEYKPTVGDVATLDGENYEVLDIYNTERVEGVDVAYTLQLRQ